MKLDAHRNIKAPNISSFGLLSVLYFIVITFITRFLIPFGDEPDFEYRRYVLMSDDHLWWSPYFLFKGWINIWSVNNACLIEASPLSLWAKIQTDCNETIYQILSRFAMTVVLMMPIFLAIIFRRLLTKVLRAKENKITLGEWILKLDALALTILIPGVIGAVGVMAEEQLVVILSLMLILVVDNIYLVMFLLYFIFSLDLGNGIVVASAVIFMRFNNYLEFKIGYEKLKIWVFVQLIVVMYFGFILIDYVPGLVNVSEKANELVGSFSEGSDLINKYPSYLRPVITFLSALYMSPAGIKIVPVYILTIYFLVIACRRFKKYKLKPEVTFYGLKINEFDSGYRRTRMASLSALNIVLFFVFLLPTYSNAKYYFFLIPFILVSLLQVFKRADMQKMLIIFNLIVFASLWLYRNV